MSNFPFRASKMLLYFVAVLFAVVVREVGAEPLSEPSEFRLNLDESDAFRLAKPVTPAPLQSAPAAVSSPLAEKPFAAEIHNAARNAALDPALVHAIIFIESGYNPAARSPKGAIGLMQILPETAARYGVQNPARSLRENLLAGTRYLSDLMLQFNNRLELVLAAYNAGENAVMRYGWRIPPYRETQLYVPAVLAKYREWQQPGPHVPSTSMQTPTQSGYEYLPGTRLNSQYPQKVSDQPANWE